MSEVGSAHPLVVWAAFHDGGRPPPLRFECPTSAIAVAEADVQSLQVSPVATVPSVLVPVKMS
jgi:hypothetical protein